MKKLTVLLVFMLFLHPSFACLILVLTNGSSVLVGNHEDWYAKDAQVVFVPSTKEAYGYVGVGFASEPFIQGGMNSEGLFFDGTATPFVPLDFSDKPAYQGFLWQAILENCATVEEAIAFLRNYKAPDLQRVHIVFADKSGASVVVGAYNEQIVLHKRSAQSYQLLTNFNLSDPSYGNEPKCTRYHTALGMLQKDTSATVENMLSILSQTHQQELTSYSTIYDLSNQDVYIFNKADFKHYKKFNLSQALNKGKSQILIGSLFP